MKSLARLIAGRYLFSNRQRFVPLLTLVALGGITLGVWSLMVVLSIMQGFQKELNHRWIGLNAHLTVTPLALKGGDYETLRAAILKWPEIKEVVAFVDGEVVVQPVRDGDPEAVAAKIRGVENVSPEFLNHVQIYPDTQADFQDLESSEMPPAVVGHELAAILGIHPDYQDALKVTYPFGEIGPSGDFVPSQKSFLLTHVFRSGLYEWDALRILVPLDQAKGLLGDQGESGLQVRLKNISDLSKIEKRLKTIIPQGSAVLSFAEQNKRLFAALKLERLAMILFLILFGLIASFSITGLLLMFIDAKRRDLAILRAIGLSLHGARQIFLTIGLLLGGIGALGGGVLGMLTCLLLHRYPIPLPSTYYLDTLPVEPQWLWGLVVMVIGLLLALVSSWYPVRLAGRMDPLPMLREE